MRIELISTARTSMERHYQVLKETQWDARILKETRTIKGLTPSWDVEETNYWLTLDSKINSDLLFELSHILKQELILYYEGDQPVIEIYDDWRE